MKTVIYFYTGTGNSLWTAGKLSDMLGNTKLVPMVASGEEPVLAEAENIGLVFPVHIWGVPSRVVDFINHLQVSSVKYCFATAVNAGQVAATLLQLKKLLQSKSIKLSSGFSLCLPSNYIPWGGAVSQEKQQKLFKIALDKIGRIAACVKSGEVKPPEKGPLWQNIIFSAIYRSSFSRVPGMDKPFSADDKCTGCKICEKICPAQNILITNGKPVWQHRCQQCFACLQWCPEEAIQYGRGTAKKKRYHHPEIKLSDMLLRVTNKKAGI
jgi:Pyruvate/2-oxoacid:ferredoxin oxidoreductase delta subunit